MLLSCSFHFLLPTPWTSQKCPAGSLQREYLTQEPATVASGPFHRDNPWLAVLALSSACPHGEVESGQKIGNSDITVCLSFTAQEAATITATERNPGHRASWGSSPGQGTRECEELPFLTGCSSSQQGRLVLPTCTASAGPVPVSVFSTKAGMAGQRLQQELMEMM